MMTSKFLADAEIERRANRLLGRYEAQYEPISNPPIPVECILEDVLDLGILWDTIPEEPGQSILAGLDPNNKTVVFNESRLALIEETPGLYNTVLGHEAGHWEAHVDPALLDQTPLPHFDREWNAPDATNVPVSAVRSWPGSQGKAGAQVHGVFAHAGLFAAGIHSGR